jgi:hypothetical protein
MPEITRELLRKKSEHNESVLSTLEEVCTQIHYWMNLNFNFNKDIIALTPHREDQYVGCLLPPFENIVFTRQPYWENGRAQ